MLEETATWPYEVAELIAEGTSTSGVAASIAVDTTGRLGLNKSSLLRPIETSASATVAVVLPKPKASNSLQALTTLLSIDNVTETQRLAKLRPNEAPPLKFKDPISDNKQLSQPSNPNKIIDKGRATRLSTNDIQEKADGPDNRASAAGTKLILDEDKKGLDGLTEEDRQKVEQMKRRDAEVRAHEQSHAAVGGPFAGAPRFRFVRGPDGKFYAVAGEVSIDTSAVPGNPRATIRKMQQVKRAALAPQEPSAQDRRVAAEAERKIIQARQDIREEEDERVKEAQGKQTRREAEAQGLSRSITPEPAPTFDPEARFRFANRGTGPAPSSGLAGTGGLDVDASDTIDPKQLFSMVA